MKTEAQKRANEKYKQSVKSILLEFPPSDHDLWQFLQQQEKKQTYIKNLIRADMEKQDK